MKRNMIGKSERDREGEREKEGEKERGNVRDEQNEMLYRRVIGNEENEQEKLKHKKKLCMHTLKKGG